MVMMAAPASTWVQLSGSFCTPIDDTAVAPRVSAAPAGRQSRWAAIGTSTTAAPGLVGRLRGDRCRGAGGEVWADAAVKVIDRPCTFLLANAVVLTVPYWALRGPRARRLTLLGAVLLLFVLLLNRRTVWLALPAGIAVVMLRKRRLGPRAAMMVATAALVMVALYVAFPEAGPGTEPVAQSVVGTGTRERRIQGWSALYASWSKDPMHWFVGQPSEAGSSQTGPRIGVQAEPHNFYILTLLRMRLVGVLSLIALTGGLLRALWRIPTRGGGLLGSGLFPAADHAAHLVHHLGAGHGTGDRHRPRRGPLGEGRAGTSGVPSRGPMDSQDAAAGAWPSLSPAEDGAERTGTSSSAGKGL
jgi:hypothetical protein